MGCVATICNRLLSISFFFFSNNRFNVNFSFLFFHFFIYFNNTSEFKNVFILFEAYVTAKVIVCSELL